MTNTFSLRCLQSALILFSGALATLAATDPFAEGVRPTPWHSPADQQKSFKLPPGFEIQLVAAEPDINKPMNLAFDAKGRLWVTTSIEYPWAAPTNKPARDRLMIFEDFEPDGRARKITEFAGGLNIPIGVYPFFSKNADGRSTWKVIVWSIPNIWLLEDTDGDNKADKREILYGPFDTTRDTHGNQASFRRGFDGWLYATHGFNNDSHVTARDGSHVDLNSGNSYRIRLDGSRVEHHTHGQVNPFGLAFDESGSLYSSDCHSEPLFQLLAGGYYPSFGKPHDGLGFVPTMMEKMRGSTAIDGVSIYTDNLWPAEFHGNMFFGDVMASSVFRDRVTEHGSTRIARALPDFVATDDPWFRPVDTQLAPDGAFYIADFYNRIIGHYEVPLTHPGRDRESGRIWRVVYKGADGRAKLHAPYDFTKASAKELVAELAHPNLTRRRLAMDQLNDRLGKDAVSALKKAVAKPENNFQQVHALWSLQRLGAAEEKPAAAAAIHKDRLVRVHAMRLLADLPKLAPAQHKLALAALNDPDGLVQRCAAEALANHPGFDNIRPLLSLVQRVPKDDTHLLYVARKSLRDQLVPEENFRRLAAETLSDADVKTITDVAIAVKSPAAAAFLLQQLPTLSKQTNPQPSIADILKHAARYAPETELSKLAEFASQRIPTGYGLEKYLELERQFALFKSIDDGLQQRGRARPESIRAWGTNLVGNFFTFLHTRHSWSTAPYEASPTATPWDLETRSATDGKKRQFTSSFPHGESLTGVLRSPDFRLPAKLSFWLCGHDGFPDKPAKNVNLVRLRLVPERGLEAASTSDALGSGVDAALPSEILATANPPRNDIARRITWELPAHIGKRVVVETVDGDTGTAYAWLAFGGFEPELPQLRPSEFAPRKMRDWFIASTDTAVRTGMKEAAEVFERACAPSNATRAGEFDIEIFTAVARAWVALAPEKAVPTLAQAITANLGAALYRESVADLLAAQNTPVAQAAAVAALKSLPLKSQEKLSFTLASATFSAETLLAAIESGVVSPRVLQRVGVNNRLKSSKPSNWETRVAKLTKTLAPANEQLEKLVEQRRVAYQPAKTKLAEGAALFTKNCAACHSIDGLGGNVGPQLNGIGSRGLERLCEDILDPNRNVDGAFRTTLLVLKDGEVTSGLFRREEGEVVVLAESTGKEINVAKKDIAERRQSDTSLMPENFGELLSADEFNHLMAYLLAKKAQP